MAKFKAGDRVMVSANSYGCPEGEYVVLECGHGRTAVRNAFGKWLAMVKDMTLISAPAPEIPDRPGAVGPRKLCPGDVVRTRGWAWLLTLVRPCQAYATRGLWMTKEGPGVWDDPFGVPCDNDIAEVISRVGTQPLNVITIGGRGCGKTARSDWTDIHNPFIPSDKPEWSTGQRVAAACPRCAGIDIPYPSGETCPVCGYPGMKSTTVPACTHYRARVERRPATGWRGLRCVDCGGPVAGDFGLCSIGMVLYHTGEWEYHAADDISAMTVGDERGTRCRQ